MFWDVYEAEYDGGTPEWLCSVCCELPTTGLLFVPTYVGREQAKWIKRMWDEEPELFVVCEKCIGERPWIRGEPFSWSADGANEWLIEQIEKELMALKQETPVEKLERVQTQ